MNRLEHYAEHISQKGEKTYFVRLYSVSSSRDDGNDDRVLTIAGIVNLVLGFRSYVVVDPNIFWGNVDRLR